MWRIAFLYLIAIFFSLTVYSQTKGADLWPEVTNEAKPWTRWWWLGSAVDQENLEFLLKEYADKGIGGVEITPIYGVNGEEPNYIDFLSEKWVSMLDITVNAATKNGMQVDMNTGTGWPFGGPTITDQYAAKTMQFHDLGRASQKEVEDFIVKTNSSPDHDLVAMQAYNRSNKRINLLEEGAKLDDIEDKNRWVIAVTHTNTGQKVKRAAPGGEGLVFNHFSKDATNHYLSRFDEAFDGNPGIRSFFNDSYELGSASSAFELFEAFKEIKGYDLALYAKELNGEGLQDEIERIKGDYRDVLGAMLLENFTKTWTDWAGKYGSLTKNQAHGSPGNLIDLYAAVGIPEMETFHSTNFPFLQGFIDQSDALHTESNHLFKKFASSAAHQKGGKLVSCETFTWLNEHFRTPLYQCKAELDEIFIKGVTHLFFHGTTYSPRRAAWPGWLFYASVHMEPNNPQWDHIGAMNQYIARCQSVLQQGQHTNDFLIFWSPDDYNHDQKKLDKKLTLHNSESWVDMPEVDVLLEKGYQFDFTTDHIITQEMIVAKGNLKTFDQSEYKTLVVPQLDRIKLKTLKKLLSHAEKGATIIFSAFPEKVSGFKDYKAQEAEMASLLTKLNLTGDENLQIASYGQGRILKGDLECALKEIGLERETLIDHRIKNISRKTKDGVYYFVANHEKVSIDKWLEFKHGTGNALFLNPLDGKVGKAEATITGEKSSVRVQLQPGESMIVYFTQNEIKEIGDFEYRKEVNSWELANSWDFRSLEGGPDMLDEKKLQSLKFWTDFPDSKNKRFAGTCEYSTVFNLENLEQSSYLLRFEKVEASARVFINGREAGTLWSFPFELEVGDYLKEGQNTLRVEVANLGGNRIRYMDQQGMKWKIFHDINIVNLHYKKLDAADWEVLPSGLSGKVELIELVGK